ncbi:hypothetical protein Xen7305DRAFT_00040430 [Xenococcus sp. PCC 7305]|uniref:DUF3084 domain-containing protein n=1 Tax=Xenococcus sp. PCC 7305 TaxID=102125 RepID=UPI0002AC74FD|nr:DUF3084 domain-containing protein [Xenococcus sp. PCC 7305]ELS04314.1 hypothetical protein Xen7305DRAFT_00040430 [Xenococcus sp. PCC 7305]
MTTSTFLLILAILLLGGSVAAFGDRLGTKVGKARLRLFNLRPRQTAMVITVLAGTFISTATFGILFLFSEPLREGLLEIDRIKRELRHAKTDLKGTLEQKADIENELNIFKQRQLSAEQKLAKTEAEFRQSKDQVKVISGQAERLRGELNTLLQERQNQIEQLKIFNQQSKELQEQLEQREQKILAQDLSISEKETSIQNLRDQQQVLQSQITTRDLQIEKLDQEIAFQDRNLQVGRNQLQELESQLEFLQREVEILEQYYQTYQDLRESRIALFKGEVLATATVRVLNPDAAVPAIDRLLGEANRNAIRAILLDNPTEADQRVVKISTAEVSQLAQQLQDGQDYVLRILSAGNYVQGEQEVRVFADLTLNQKVFTAGEDIATVSIESSDVNNVEVQERVDWLLAASRFRAQRAGMIGDLQVGDGQITNLIRFIEEITSLENSLGEIKALVAESTYTAGPLKLNLVLIQNGEIVVNSKAF